MNDTVPWTNVYTFTLAKTDLWLV